MRSELTDVEVIDSHTLDLWAFVDDGLPVFDSKSKGVGQGAIRAAGDGRTYLYRRRRPPCAVEVRSFLRLRYRAVQRGRPITFVALRPAP